MNSLSWRDEAKPNQDWCPLQRIHPFNIHRMVRQIEKFYTERRIFSTFITLRLVVPVNKIVSLYFEKLSLIDK